MKTLFALLLILLLVSCSSATYSRERSRYATHTRINNNKLLTVAKKWIGTPYKYGGTGHNGIDCSALVRAIYKEAYNYNLPRTSKEQYKKGKTIRQNWIEKGDLIFFKSSRAGDLNHVGIYLGNNKFIHASQKKGVIISNFNSSYYQQRIYGIKRYLP